MHTVRNGCYTFIYDILLCSEVRALLDSKGLVKHGNTDKVKNCMILSIHIKNSMILSIHDIYAYSSVAIETLLQNLQCTEDGQMILQYLLTTGEKHKLLIL